MGNKLNSSSTASTSGSNKSNTKIMLYRERKGNSDVNSAKPKPAVRELKFYLHDSSQRKMSESFGIIKEAIVLMV